MIPLRDGLNALHEETCIKVYNPEEQKLIAVFASMHKAANRLGVAASKIQVKCSTKKRIFSPVLNMYVAVRIAARKEEDNVLIKKTSSYQPL